MFVLAHVSDLHMAGRPRLAELAGKRGLGVINWYRKRKYIHRPDVLEAITRDLTSQTRDHVAVTGDLVNFSLEQEYRRAAAWLASLGPPREVSVVPGNHDTYVRGTEAAPAAFWGDTMRGDDGIDRFPYLRRRGEVALIALSTALPTGPLMATGRLGSRQLARFAEALDQTRGLFRIVLIHHPPQSPWRRHLRRLVDAAQLRAVLAAQGAELLLHGHDHRRAVIWLDGPQATKIPAVGVPSASARAAYGGEDAAGYHIFHIDKAGGAWRCQWLARQRDADGAVREISRQMLVP
jgi:3',5'-cyclic AMP phosphodiesterase CpdA